MNIKGDLVLIMLLLVFLTIWIVRLYPSNDDTFSVSAIEGFGNIGVYKDKDCNSPYYRIDWGVLTPGENKDISVYVRNEGDKTFFLYTHFENWNSDDAEDSLEHAISVNFNETNEIKAGEVVKEMLKLEVPLEIEISHFSVDITFILWSPDIDGDGEVDCRDLSPVAKAYESVENDLLYDERYDLNCDGRINHVDLAMIGRHFGRTDL